LHFGSKKMSGIGKYLVFLHQKAIKTLQSCETEIQSLCSNLDVEVTDDMLDSWKTEEDNAVNMRGVSSTQTSTTDIADWRRTYYEKLKSFYKESSLALISEKVSDVALHQRKAKRMASALNSFEMRNKVSKRWTVASEEYRKQHEKYLKEKSKETLSTLYSRCSERLMLLVLKKRYADGSAIATRLSKQINKVCSEIKNLLSSYNSVNLEISSRFIVVTYTEVLNVKSTIYNGITYLANVQCSAVPSTVIKTLIQYNLRKHRAREEILIVEAEMQETISYWEEQVKVLRRCFELQTSFGTRHIISEKLKSAMGFLLDLKSCFSSSSNTLPTSELNVDVIDLFDDESSASNLSDSDSDSNDSHNNDEDFYI